MFACAIDDVFRGMGGPTPAFAGLNGASSGLTREVAASLGPNGMRQLIVGGTVAGSQTSVALSSKTGGNGSKSVSSAPRGLRRAPEAPEMPAFDGETTHGVLVSRDGKILQRFSSGSKNPAYKNYASAGHVEGKAAIWMRENGITDAVLYHNNPSGTCNWCHPQISTLLAKGAKMQVKPPLGTITPSSRWHVRAEPYVGNNRVPKTSN